MPPKPLTCDICGVDRSRTGKPFDRARLLKHKSIVHAAGKDGGEAIACDICGATHSNRGVPFLTMASVRQHKSKLHPGSPESVPSETEVVKGSRKPKSGGSRPLNGIASRQRGNHVKFCPQCGCNLEVVHAAMSFVHGEEGL